MAGILRVDTVALNHSFQSSATQPLKTKVTTEVIVNDNRTNEGGWIGGQLGKLRVGHAENSFGESIAPHIAVARPLTDSFKEAIYTKLASTGDENKTCSAIILNVNIEHFYTKFKNNFGMYIAIADLRFNAKINNFSGVAYANKINSTGVSPPSFWQEGKTAEVALNEAFKRGINDLFQNKDFLSALSEGCSK